MDEKSSLLISDNDEKMNTISRVITIMEYIIMSDSGKPLYYYDSLKQYNNKQQQEYDHRDNTNMVQLCAFIQALRTSLIYNPHLQKNHKTSQHDNGIMNDIQSIRTKLLNKGDDCLIVMMTIGNITFVVIEKQIQQEQPTISSFEKQDITNTSHNNLPLLSSSSELYLRYQLEYIFSIIIFHMTDYWAIINTNHKHNYDNDNDIETTLYHHQHIIHIILHNMNSNDNNRCCFLLGSITSLYPLSYQIRYHVSRTLQKIGNSTPNIIYAILFSCSSDTPRLISLIQSNDHNHQMNVSDIIILLHFLQKQHSQYQQQSTQQDNEQQHSQQNSSSQQKLPQQLQNNELWLPICLPRFNSSNYMHCYTQCLSSFHISSNHDNDTNDPSTPSASENQHQYGQLTLALISPNGSMEQFHSFRNASIKIRHALHIPDDINTIIEIIDTNNDNDTMIDNTNNNVTSDDDIPWRIMQQQDMNPNDDNNDSNVDDENYDDDDYVHINDHDIVHLANSKSSSSYTSSSNRSSPKVGECRLLRELECCSCYNISTDDYLMKTYLLHSSSSRNLIYHFMFRYEAVPITKSNNHQQQHQYHLPSSSKPTTTASKYHQDTTTTTTTTSYYLNQCINSPFMEPYKSADDKSYIWDQYEKLIVRNRLSSSSTSCSSSPWNQMIRNNNNFNNNNNSNDDDTMLVFPSTKYDNHHGNKGHDTSSSYLFEPLPSLKTIESDCHAMNFFESSSALMNGNTTVNDIDEDEEYIGNIQMSYIAYQHEIFFSLCGNGYELYFFTLRSIPISQIHDMGMQLLRQLLTDKNTLFHTNPLTWSENNNVSKRNRR